MKRDCNSLLSELYYILFNIANLLSIYMWSTGAESCVIINVSSPYSTVDEPAADSSQGATSASLPSHQQEETAVHSSTQPEQGKGILDGCIIMLSRLNWMMIIFTTAEPVASGFVDVSAGSHPLSAPVEVAKSTSSQSEHQGTSSFVLSLQLDSTLYIQLAVEGSI